MKSYDESFKKKIVELYESGKKVINSDIINVILG